jgi:putative ATP-dependent endonuclease of OLD family
LPDFIRKERPGVTEVAKKSKQQERKLNDMLPCCCNIMQNRPWKRPVQLDKSVEPPVPIPIDIEVVLADLHQELATKCFDHLERWHRTEKRLLAEGEIDLADHANVSECLRIRTTARYDVEEDEFEAKSTFCSGPTKPDGDPLEVPRKIRQLFGFFYLRALRTGARALSLERGSLLDIILQRRKIRTGIWENAIEQLRNLDPPIDEGAVDLAPVLDNVEKRLAQYIPLTAEGRATQLFVSQLRREHLRKTIAFFLRTSNDQEPVPFQEAGTGTRLAAKLQMSLLSSIFQQGKRVRFERVKWAVTAEKHREKQPLLHPNVHRLY